MTAHEILMAIGELDEELLEETETPPVSHRPLPLRRVILVAAMITAMTILLGAAFLGSVPVNRAELIQSVSDFCVITDETGDAMFLSKPPATQIVMDVQIDRAGPLKSYFLPEVPEEWALRSGERRFRTVNEKTEYTSFSLTWDLPSGGFVRFCQISSDQYEQSGHVVDSVAVLPGKEYLHSGTTRLGNLDVLWVTLEPLSELEQQFLAPFTDYMPEGENRIYWSDGGYVFSLRCPASVTREEILGLTEQMTELSGWQFQLLKSMNQEKEESMMKRLSTLFAALVLAVFGNTGCQMVDVPEEPVTTAPSVAETAPAKEPGNSLIEYDPDREIYVHCGNVQTTGFMDPGGYSLPLVLYSKYPLTPEDVRIEIDCENRYEITNFSENVVLRQTQYSRYGDQEMWESSCYPYYLYQNVRGTDFALIGTLWDLYRNLPEYGTEEYEAMEALVGDRTPWEVRAELLEEYWADYTALTEEDIPEFYAYILAVNFNGETEETVHEMTFHVKDTPYAVPVGNLHLMPEGWPQSHPLSDDVYVTEGGGLSFSVNHYSDGTVAFWGTSFTALDAMTLTELNFLTGDWELLDAMLRITSGGMTVESSWGGDTDVMLYPGDEVAVYLVVRSPVLRGIHYHTDLYYELNMMVDGEMTSLTNEMTFSAVYGNHHEIYAMVFEGLDLEPYYREHYYRITEPWCDYME